MIISANDLYIKRDAEIAKKVEPKLFIETILDITRENDNIIREMMAELYSDYTKPQEVFRESFNTKFSLISIVKSIIDLFVKLINNIWNAFKKFIGYKPKLTDKDIIKHKDVILNYKDTIEVDYGVSQYSDFGLPMPVTSLKIHYDNEFDRLKGFLSELSKNGAGKIEVINSLNAYNEERRTATISGYFDYIRANTMDLNPGEDSGIPENEYKDRITRFYLSNDTILSTIDNNIIRSAYNRYIEDGNRIMSSIEKEKKVIDKECESMKKAIEKLKPGEYLTGKWDTDVEFALNNLLKTESGIISELCKIYSTAFSIKLTTLQDALNQDRKVLYTVLNKVLSEKEEN